jgi:hypothetical protein
MRRRGASAICQLVRARHKEHEILVSYSVRTLQLDRTAHMHLCLVRGQGPGVVSTSRLVITNSFCTLGICGRVRQEICHTTPEYTCHAHGHTCTRRTSPVVQVMGIKPPRFGDDALCNLCTIGLTHTFDARILRPAEVSKFSRSMKYRSRGPVTAFHLELPSSRRNVCVT